MPRTATTLHLGALALATCAAWSAWKHQWLPAAGLAYGAFLLACLAAARNQHDRAVRTRHEQARRAAALDDQTLADVPVPCCSFWRHSEGKVHGPGCTRPPLPRRDTIRLTDREQAVFEEIVAHEEGSAA
jgi:hypothetical protein